MNRRAHQGIIRRRASVVTSGAMCKSLAAALRSTALSMAELLHYGSATDGVGEGVRCKCALPPPQQRSG